MSGIFMQLPIVGKLNNPTPWIAGLVTAGVLGVGTVAIVSRRNPTAQIENLTELTVPVEAADVTVQIEATGEVQPEQRVNLSPKVQGRLERLFVEQGDRVSRGEVVAQMESQEVAAQLAQAQARLDRARANLAELENGARPEEIDRARAGVRQARSQLQRSQAQLAELRAGSRREDIAEAEAAVERADAAVAEVESRLALAQQDVRRNQQLYRDGAISRQDLDRAIDEERRARASLQQVRASAQEARRRLERLRNGARTEEIDRAEAEVTSARASLEEAQSRLDELLNGTRPEDIAAAQADVMEAEAQVQYYEVQLEDTRVRAPFPGIIAQRYADEGAFVTPATSASNVSSATSTSIVALAKGLEVLAKVPEADISQVYTGQSVEIVADAYPDEVFEGRVKIIAPEAIEERDVTLFQVRLDVLTGEDQLRSGMNVDLTFLGDRLSDALVLPIRAIVTRRGETGVLVPEEGDRAEFQPVTIGPTLGDRVQILDGVRAGDRVFVELPEGQELDDILEGS
ncbi:efflux RND transporter periplasmic adaptor subunit [Baaleninema sp.]|uniref:efflux RND transporter periplasmic adaptor subunit n=1 Tax=Baaleninema sp. TaxID=3101197 RepID=UPI003CFDB21B